ncbi:MAG: M81 family metallopeptidase [Gemmatimonadota bacterium]|nr:M81 family metallopeptidase [Gemmatimonadota bacterium]
MRVGILSLMHESNTFIGTPTTLEMFRSSRILIGNEVADLFEDGLNEVSGFFQGLAESGIEAVPLFYAGTEPSGRITKGTCDALMQMMFEQVERAGEPDGWLVAPHGANVGEGEDYWDLDGYWLSRLRRIVGEGTPIICTIDPHANLSERMIEACDATIAYRSNPHLDQKEVGLQASRLMARTLRGEVRPTQAASFPPIAINIERQLTGAAPCRPMYDLADRLLDRPGVLSNSIVLGFPYSDVPEMGAATIAVTDGDVCLGEAVAGELADYLHTRRSDFKGAFIGIRQAVDVAVAVDGPVCLLDMGDNVGGGSAGDGTMLAHELHGRGDIRAFVCLYDREAVSVAAAAGVGARATLRMGGKTDDLHGPPLEVSVTVRGVYGGRFRESEIRHGGRTAFDMGQTAVVDTDNGLTISLTSRRVVPVSLGLMTSCDLRPDAFDVIVAKGVHAPVAAYAPVCTRLIRVDTPGATAADMRKFEFHHRRRPLYPFEEI